MPDKFYTTYLQIKGIKGLLDDEWDNILKDYPELEWVKGARADPVFREYYKLMGDLEQLKQLEVK